MKFFFHLLLINATIFPAAHGMDDSILIAKNHNLQFYVGKLAYANTLNLPNGLPGNLYSFRYTWHKASSESGRSLHFSSHFSSAALRYNISANNEINLYRFSDMAIEVGWHWRVPKILPKTVITLGFGPSLVAELIYPTREALDISDILNPFGLWGLNCSGHIQAVHSIKQFTFEWGFGFSAFGLGHVPMPPYINLNVWQNPYSYYFRPNAAYHMLNYRMLSGQWTVSTPHNNHLYSISYIFKYFNHSLSLIHQRYAQHSLGLGITF
jgi:hypothetical protein